MHEYQSGREGDTRCCGCSIYISKISILKSLRYYYRVTVCVAVCYIGGEYAPCQKINASKFVSYFSACLISIGSLALPSEQD